MLRAQKMKKMPKLQNSLIEFFNNLFTYKTIKRDFFARLLETFEQSISENCDIFAMLISFVMWQLEWTIIDKKVTGKHNCKEFIDIILKFRQTV